MNVTGANVAPSGSFPGDESGTTVTLNAGSYSVDEGAVSGYTKSIGSDCSGSIANGETKTCTVTNDDQPGTLVVKKHVINDSGGSKVASNFTMSVTGANVAPSGSFPGDESGTTVTLNAGSYSVGETGPSGYSGSNSSDCSGSIANGETKTCTVTNDDQPGTLVVKKHVINNDGGTKAASDFTMNVTGANVAPLGYFRCDDTGIRVPVNAGSYSVDEGDVSGYTKSIGSDCSG